MTETDGQYAWLRLVLTLLVASVANAGMWLVITIMPAVEAEFGTSRADSALPYTLTMIGFALGNFLIGRAVDRFGVTWSLVLAALAIACGISIGSALRPEPSSEPIRATTCG